MNKVSSLTYPTLPIARPKRDKGLGLPTTDISAGENTKRCLESTGLRVKGGAMYMIVSNKHIGSGNYHLAEDHRGSFDQFKLN